MIRGCAIILGTFLGVLPDFWVSFFGEIFFVWESPRFFGTDLDICRALVSYFLQSDLTYSCKQRMAIIKE